MFCTICGNFVEQDERYCPYCGMSMSSAGVAFQTSAPTEILSAKHTLKYEAVNWDDELTVIMAEHEDGDFTLSSFEGHEDNLSFKWAVIGVNRDYFTDEFIATHPMDFYENEEQIKGEYDYYLRNEHEIRTLSIEYRANQCYSFRSQIAFCGADLNHADRADFRLRHLRMLLGSEPGTLFPYTFADIYSCLANRRIEIDSRSFPNEYHLSKIIEWISDNESCFYKDKKDLILIVEGDYLWRADNLMEEITRARFGFEISFCAFFVDETNSDRTNVSFLWYDTATEVKSLRATWDGYINNKLEYISGKKSIDTDDYCELVKNTWLYIEKISWEIRNATGEGDTYKPHNKFFYGFYEYMMLVEDIKEYSMMVGLDNSKDYMFTVTAILADGLARFASGRRTGIPQYGHSGSYMGVESLYSPDGTVLASAPGSKDIVYNVRKKNYQVLFEVARRINEIC